MAKAKKVTDNPVVDSEEVSDVVADPSVDAAGAEEATPEVAGSGYPEGKVGAEYVGQLEAGGAHYVCFSGSIPDGVKLDEATGALSGTPTPESQGVSNFKVKVTDTDGNDVNEIVGQIVVGL